jgi:DNA repair protein RecO (recombination protein O)
MPGPLSTEAIVLRSMRYGEADRILHVYTPMRGRVGAIAKGVRRSRSRFGGRLEPFFRLRLGLHEGRSELLTVTSAETVAAFPRLREDPDALDAAARACDAVGRLFDSAEPHPEVFNLLGTLLAQLDADPGRAAAPERRVAFRLKLLLAAGYAPQLGACASCGEAGPLTGFSPAAGGVVCAACEAGAFALDAETHDFLVSALGRPLAEAPAASARSLRLADRVVVETAEHHGHVRLRAAS